MSLFTKTWYEFINRKFYQWIGRRMPEKSGIVKLNLHSTYILPTRYGMLFGFILYGMLMSSINFSNSLGFLLTFLLTGICLTGMLHTFRNLVSVQISTARSPAVFAGETAVFYLRLETIDGRPAYALAAGKDRRGGRKTDVEAGQKQLLELHVPAERRGRLQLGRIRIWSEFPLGLFHVWSWIEPDANLIVYPRSSGTKYSTAFNRSRNGKWTANDIGHDDFAGLRRYHPGDSSRHIDWKAVARGYEILTKQFTDSAGDEIWLDWDHLQHLDPEQRLSQLCRWVLDLHRSNCKYGLKLPDCRIEPSRGEAHKHECLTRLALFEW
ncbi:MAG TPA: DUF58 domain-containing protein [Gammaproteobacteria bacterium]|nr:DUF58 domain-containing protein [Gammaproteobacteria bacterium]